MNKLFIVYKSKDEGFNEITWSIDTPFDVDAFDGEHLKTFKDIILKQYEDWTGLKLKAYYDFEIHKTKCKNCNDRRIWRENGDIILCGKCFHK